jgi:plastocyanin
VGAAPIPITIVNFDYGPRTVTVGIGTTVNWANASDRPHTVTDRGGTFDSEPILPGRSASVTFTAPGTYFYFCRVNPSKMNGVVVVTPAPEPSAVVRVQTVDPTNIAGEQFRFDPPTFTVTAGSTLLVANVGGKPHTLTADDGTFTTGVIAPGADGGRFAGSHALLTLNKPGTYPFHCEIHPLLMHGVIGVIGTPPAQTPPAASNAPAHGTIVPVNFAFQPVQLTVAPGAKLTVTNRGQAPHTVTFDDLSLDTGPLQPGSTAQLSAPPQPGSYSYHCAVHPAKMRGVLVVLGQNVADPGAAAPPKQGGVAGGGPGGRVATFVLVTSVLGALLGGVGIGAFVRRPPSTGGA